MNSLILDWYFRLSSTNSKVNEYQFNLLPIPEIAAPDGVWRSADTDSDSVADTVDKLLEMCGESGSVSSPVAAGIVALSRRLQEIEGRRILKNRFERARLALESQPFQDAVDAIWFKCYGLSEDDAEFVRGRLAEML